jgi:hypothetical protein
MRRLFLLGCLIFVGVLGWRLGERLSPDALGMALGVLFGILAGIPTALIVLTSARRRDEDDRDDDPHGRSRSTAYPADYRGVSHQPPVIILAGNGAPAPYGQPHNYGATNPYPMMEGQARPALPGPTQRQYKVVGEKEEWLDEFS